MQYRQNRRQDHRQDHRQDRHQDHRQDRRQDRRQQRPRSIDGIRHFRIGWRARTIGDRLEPVGPRVSC
jgi:hypothetical protein